jgi:hypothetical protein
MFEVYLELPLLFKFTPSVELFVPAVVALLNLALVLDVSNRHFDIRMSIRIMGLKCI